MLCVRRRWQRGLTIVELLASIAILGIGLVALSQLYLAAMFTYQRSYYMSVATQRAQYEYEKVQNLGFYALANGPSAESYMPGEYTVLSPGPGVSFNVDQLPKGRGTVTWSRFPANTQGNANQLRVVITVGWTGMKQAASDVQIISLIANK
ncbi:MAG: type IV pilus modification PilV family protein [Armatimonadota bacterium]